MTLPVPPRFCWGVATAAFQIEGAWDADGKGPSVWDTLGHRGPGFVGGANGDVTCDHYHRWAEDVALLRELGVTSYRFSVSWPRVQPDGRGRPNQAGLDFYRRLADSLVEAGIEPTVTLYHWDHPQAIEDEGGWTNRDTAERFADYTTLVAESLGDRVARWITLNEPQSVLVGHILGFSRPAGPLGMDALPVAHHLLLAHGRGLERLRAACPDRPAGIALNVSGVEPATGSEQDQAAAARAEAYEERLFLDPVLTGRYPQLDGRPLVGADPSDLAVIAQPIDFLGVNWYAPARVAHHEPDTSGSRRAAAGITDLEALFAGLAELLGYTRTPYGPDTPTNMLGNPVLPERLGATLLALRDRYPALPPILVTENGLPRPDQPDPGGHVSDPDRIDYLARCLEGVAGAIDAGVDVGGYFVWSLLDNLEWGLGFGPRFGLVHVDFGTLTRTPKDSFHWYRQLIADHQHTP